jgi:hypothetical protein
MLVDLQLWPGVRYGDGPPAEAGWKETDPVPLFLFRRMFW